MTHFLEEKKEKLLLDYTKIVTIHTIWHDSFFFFLSSFLFFFFYCAKVQINSLLLLLRFVLLRPRPKKKKIYNWLLLCSEKKENRVSKSNGWKRNVKRRADHKNQIRSIAVKYSLPFYIVSLSVSLCIHKCRRVCECECAKLCMCVCECLWPDSCISFSSSFHSHLNVCHLIDCIHIWTDKDSFKCKNQTHNNINYYILCEYSVRLCVHLSYMCCLILYHAIQFNGFYFEYERISRVIVNAIVNRNISMNNCNEF